MERLSIDEAISNFKLFHKEDLEKLTYEEDFLKRFGYTKERLNTSAERNSQLVEWLEELKAYRNAEEQGLLLRLPIAEGTEVFCIGSCGELCDDYEADCEVCGEHQVVFNTIFDRNMIEQFGETVFATEKEAETILQEMKGE